MRIVRFLHSHWHSGSHTQVRQCRHIQLARSRHDRKPAYWHHTQTVAFCTRQRPPNPNPNGSPRPKRPWEPALAFLDWYSHSQSRRPYLIQLCLTPVIYCIGDFSAQMIGDDDFDPRRSLRSMIVGLVIAIPSREWFLFLGRQFNYAQSPTLSLCAKVAANQLFYTSLFNVYFFAFHGLLSGEGLMGAVERVKNTVPTSIPRSFLYWPLVTAFNFTYVQPQSRSVATSVFAVFWQSYLSWLNSSAERGTEMRICQPVSSNVGEVEDLDRQLLLFDDD
ncbi:hypothetical protein ABOM_003853 [Aspergillus bombycis]|uniref:Integral membrane protein n=1 Tax=Aspergillus bombycis TaxID=109264 RepID=A0A1F8A6L9_9EURO|nr:hypothetical protein ABOM_003853 [Aspergillus bombycis]OGM47337.1 hypothetical protein ABOM_003853 [Aspergillus bombycis]